MNHSRQIILMHDFAFCANSSSFHISPNDTAAKMSVDQKFTLEDFWCVSSICFYGRMHSSILFYVDRKMTRSSSSWFHVILKIIASRLLLSRKNSSLHNIYTPLMESFVKDMIHYCAHDYLDKVKSEFFSTIQIG